MSNVATVVAKVAALVGGALLGVLLTRWLDDQLAARRAQHFNHDKMRYAQGLAPLER
jgi:hypothetical protein